MNTNNNDNPNSIYEFNIDSILLEFGALKEEPESKAPVFEPRLPIKDASGPEDAVFSSAIEDGLSENDDDSFGIPFRELASALKESGGEPSDTASVADFDSEDILQEFESDDPEELESTIDPNAVRAEFENDGTLPKAVPMQQKAASEPVPVAASALKTSVTASDDFIDSIVKEFRAAQDSAVPPQAEPESEQVISPADGLEVDIMSEPTQERPDIGPDPEAELIDDADAFYAEADEYEAPQEEMRARPKPRKKSFRESVAAPVISALAFIAMKVNQSQLSVGSASYETEDLGEEMPPEKAAKFYDKHIAGLRLRTRISFILSAVLIYISYGLPLAGAFADVGVKSAVCLILMLAVMLCGLDIITSGIMSLVRLKPHANGLIAVSCLLCAIDAFVIAFGAKKVGLPFCAVPALTISFTLLGCVLNARSNRIVFNTAASTRRPYTLTAEAALSGGDITLLKSLRTTDGFVRRTEEDGPDEAAFGLMTPYLIVGALVLSLVSAVIGKSFAGFAHILSGIFVCAAPAAMLITFPLPFFVSVKSLIKNGSAIAGWSGLYDIGKAKHLIITDADLFPNGCVKIGRTRILSGMKPEKVISFAASIISASGSALVPAFSELMRKGNGSLLTVEAFTVHESGGLIAMVDGEEVFCGNAGFMRLMGMHLPEKFVVKDCVYVAASGSICGVFEIEYTATEAVRSSLEALMGSSRHPIFAIRDFNITPQMLSTKFDIATDGFDFPAYPDRYEISGAVPSDDSKPAALISREGLEPLISLADHGRLLYGRIRLNVMLSVLSTVIGVVMMFILSLSGSLSVVTALTYLLGWLLLAVILSFTINTP
ncbi:MAG: hypothetical protein ACI3VK_06510 [Oscillospiraceae bacterium]